MKTIRKSVFETNSSSSHCIAITGSGYTSTYFYGHRQGDDDVCILYPGEFGWGIDTHSDPETKASYILTWLLNHGDEDRVETFRRKLEDHTGKTIEFGRSEDEFYSDGYIDHNSYEVAQDILGQGWDYVITFIFNSAYRLIIDNDNH